MRSVSVNLPEPLLEKLDLFCREHNISRSEAVRRAVCILLGEEYKPLKKVASNGRRCPICGKYLGSPVLHIAEVHRDIVAGLAEKHIFHLGRNMLACRLCGKIFHGTRNGIYHIAKHIMEAPEKLLKEG